MIANYHTHTPRCGHADGAERAYLDRALAGGFRVLGFSDHSPYFFEGGDRSRIRMNPEELEGYVAALTELREEYRGRIELRIGLEAEYYPRLFPRLTDYLAQFPIEYLILGQHGLFNEQEGIWTGTPTTEERLLDQYCGQTAEALDTGYFLYFAHPDILHFVGDPAVYDRHMRRLCRKARDLGVPLEFNLLGFWERKQYPNPVFWRIAAEEGCSAVLGCDAHHPEDTWLPELEKKARELLLACGIPEPLERLKIKEHFMK